MGTVDGKTLTGLLAEDRPDRLVLRDPSQDGKVVTFSNERSTSGLTAVSRSCRPVC